MPQIHFSFELLIFLNFAPETFLGEVRIRFVRILIGLGLTWFTRYWFPEESIYSLDKPFIMVGPEVSIITFEAMDRARCIQLFSGREVAPVVVSLHPDDLIFLDTS